VPRVFPFRSLVYDPAVAGPLDRVTAPPYDVISEARLRELRTEPSNIVRVDLARDPGSEDHGSGEDRYQAAGELLHRWTAKGVLRREEPAFHAYEMRFGSKGRFRRVRGVFAAMELEGWGGNVLPHEETMPGPIEDRLRLLRAARTHLSAVYGIVAGPCPPLADLMDRTMRQPPAGEVVDEQGVRHRRWRIEEDQPVSAWLGDQPLLIADGHHRYTTALAYRDEMRSAAGPGPWDRLLTFIVDAGSEELTVAPFHRVQLSGAPPTVGVPVSSLADALAACSDDDTVVGLIVPKDGDVEVRVVSLDGEPPAVRALHAELIPALPPSALRYTPDAEEAAAAVRAGNATAAYLLPPTTPDRVREVVERGERLPQKSTYFWPKPLTGMVLMPIQGINSH
jgi:uncharacterized protein (DUF1015 family)